MKFGTSIMTSESDERHVHTVTMLVDDERVWFARTAIMLNRAQSQRCQSVLCMMAYPWEFQSASYLGMKEKHL